MNKINHSKHVYLIVADRNTSQFGQKIQEVRCHIIDARRPYLVVESMKRYNRIYRGAERSTGKYEGVPVRRINKDQILRIKDEKTGKVLSYETVRRREGTDYSPGRSRPGGR